MNVPSSLVRDRVLMPTLDARAHNLRQARLIANPTPEVDSIVEHIAVLIETSSERQRPHLAALLDLVRDLAASNHAEGDHQQAVAGVVDRLAAELRRHETTARTQFGVQQLARVLRKPLEVIVNARREDGTKYVTALRQINDVLRLVPAVHLLDNAGLRHELGLAKYDALTHLVEERSR